MRTVSITNWLLVVCWATVLIGCGRREVFAQSGQLALSWRGHTDFVWSVAFSPDGKRIVSGSEDKSRRHQDYLVKTPDTGCYQTDV